MWLSPIKSLRPGALACAWALPVAALALWSGAALGASARQPRSSSSVRTGGGINFTIVTPGGQVRVHHGSARRGARFLGWSQTGSYFAYDLGFNSRGRQKVIIAATDGSSEVTVAHLGEHDTPGDLTWAPDDQIVAYHPWKGDSVTIVAPRDGVPVPGLQQLRGQPVGWTAKAAELVLFENFTAPDFGGDLVARSPSSGVGRTVASGVHYAVVSPDGTRVAWIPAGGSDRMGPTVISDLGTGAETSRTLGVSPIQWRRSDQLLVNKQNAVWLWDPALPLSRAVFLFLSRNNIDVAASGLSAVRLTPSAADWRVRPRRVVSLTLPGKVVTAQFIWQSAHPLSLTTPSPDGQLIALWTDMFE